MEHGFKARYSSVEKSFKLVRVFISGLQISWHERLVFLVMLKRIFGISDNHSNTHRGEKGKENKFHRFHRKEWLDILYKKRLKVLRGPSNIIKQKDA